MHLGGRISLRLGVKTKRNDIPFYLEQCEYASDNWREQFMVVVFHSAHILRRLEGISLLTFVTVQRPDDFIFYI